MNLSFSIDATFMQHSSMEVNPHPRHGGCDRDGAEVITSLAAQPRNEESGAPAIEVTRYPLPCHTRIHAVYNENSLLAIDKTRVNMYRTLFTRCIQSYDEAEHAFVLVEIVGTLGALARIVLGDMEVTT
jgi:hypothetical protein